MEVVVQMTSLIQGVISIRPVIYKKGNNSIGMKQNLKGGGIGHLDSFKIPAKY